MTQTRDQLPLDGVLSRVRMPQRMLDAAKTLASRSGRWSKADNLSEWLRSVVAQELDREMPGWDK